MLMKKTVALLAVLISSSLFVAGQSEQGPADVSQSGAGAVRPDLVPILAHPMNGKILVRNVGAGFAAPTKLTLDCERVSTPVGSCPDLPVSAASTYFDPSFPKNATIEVPEQEPSFEDWLNTDRLHCAIHHSFSRRPVPTKIIRGPRSDKA